MNTTTVKGMVISSMPIGEYDRRLEILTDSLGRISAFARGARKPQSSLVSVSRVFAFGEFDLYEGKSAYSLNAARISNYFEELSNNVDITYFGFYFLEVAKYFSRENINALDMLKLLYQSLRALSVEPIDNRLVKAIYELKMLDINGFCNIDKELERVNVMEATEYALRFVVLNPIEKLYTFKLTQECLLEFQDIVRTIFKKIVDKSFNSEEMIAGILES